MSSPRSQMTPSSGVTPPVVILVRPQLYVKGEFVGGCDIVREMYETGELTEMMQTRGIDAKPAA